MGSISGRVCVTGKTNWLRCRWVRVCLGRRVVQSLSVDRAYDGDHGASDTGDYVAMVLLGV